jgi:hypothetical protein
MNSCINVFFSQNVIRTEKLKTRRTGHVAHIGDNRNECMYVLVGNGNVKI